MQTRAEGARLSGVLDHAWWVLGAVLPVLTLTTWAAARSVRRWKRNMDVGHDTPYTAMLAHLSEGSVRRHFNPYTDIDWDSSALSISPNDPRWVLSTSEPLGRHPWYQAQPLERQIAIGMWYQANVAMVTLNVESILIRGLLQYAFCVPNGSPEYRYCLHEAVEECNHSMMFQEMVNRLGMNAVGLPRWLRWLSGTAPLTAGPMPNVFFFGVLAGEVPIDYRQKTMLREDGSLHPLMEKVMAIHVAEESRHISFAHEYLRKRVPHMPRFNRFWLSVFVPVIMRVLCQASVVPPHALFTEFDIPRSLRKELFFDSPDSRQTLQDMFADVRMLCHDVGLMNPLAKLTWRACKIDGPPSRYRGEPQRSTRPRPSAGARMA